MQEYYKSIRPGDADLLNSMLSTVERYLDGEASNGGSRTRGRPLVMYVGADEWEAIIGIDCMDQGPLQRDRKDEGFTIFGHKVDVVFVRRPSYFHITHK